MEEIWKPITEYEGLYEVSNLCRVRTVKHYVNHWKGGLKRINQSIRKQRIEADGRPRVVLSKNGVNRKFPTYRLMAIAFLPNPNGYKEINHKDENPSNNSLDNLEWCDRKYNINYGTRTLRSKITKRQPLLAYKNGNPFMFFSSSQEAAHILNVSVSLISMAIHNKTKAKGLIFKKI